ncbi:hypothetical protein [Burkholderia territorii]|uniref:hypothetical protein n=1 Tax=Burkholderia territorii TaxID=1503055 RepID=UPI001E4F2E2C|nr:hypothetical protein [Burkholderia territorii]
MQHTIAVRRATQFSNAPRPPRKEKSFTQVVAQYVDAWLKDRKSRRLVKRPAAEHREAVHRAGDVAILKRSRRALDRFGDEYVPVLHAALREQMRDDRPWHALVELSGVERARFLIAEVDAALAEGRAVDARMFERRVTPPNHLSEPDTRDFRTLSLAERQDRRRQFREKLHHDAAIAKATRDRSRGGGYGMGVINSATERINEHIKQRGREFTILHCCRGLLILSDPLVESRSAV